jgi:hypothetical protein
VTDPCEVGSFWKELPKQSVGIFVCAALPCGVWSGEMNYDARASGQPFMLRKFSAVVKCHAPPQVSRQAIHTLRGRDDHWCGLKSFDFADYCVSGFAFDHCHNRDAMAFADHRVAFPIAESTPAVNYLRPSFDPHAFF